jgi:hypothetical protein
MIKHSNGWLRFTRHDGHRSLFDSASNNTIDLNNLFGDGDDVDSDFGALMPIMHHSSSRSTAASPQPSSHYGLIGNRSCPATPQMQRRLSEKDGATQLTSLSTLLTHHRHLFLFKNFLVIAKEKLVVLIKLTENTYKHSHILEEEKASNSRKKYH